MKTLKNICSIIGGMAIGIVLGNVFAFLFIRTLQVLGIEEGFGKFMDALTFIKP